MRSLQFKFTLALLFTSLISVVLVGFVARHVMLDKFNRNAMEDALTEFRGQVKTYITTYGSWENGQRAIPFPVWRDHQNAQLASRAALNVKPPTETEGPPPPPEPGERDSGLVAARFRFAIIDSGGRVLMGPPDKRGQLAPRDWREAALPVLVNSKPTVSVVPYGEPEMSPDDRRNMGVMRESLLRGAALAMLLAIALGIGLAHALSRKLRELAVAMRAVGQGELRQSVSIRSNDEIGELAATFNRMSEELALTHEKLQQSHAQITEQAKRLEELSIRDELTQLYNRRHFDTQVAQIYGQAARYERPLTVMIGDIDHFKRINDTFSHAVGDEVLRHVSAILKKMTRQSDIVARYGGEEFVIAFPETPLPQALALCERLRAQIEAYPWSKIQPALRVTMSMGLCNDLQLGSAEKMVAGADELLYYAKEHGRNRVCTFENLKIESGALLAKTPAPAVNLVAQHSASQ